MTRKDNMGSKKIKEEIIMEFTYNNYKLNYIMVGDRKFVPLDEELAFTFNFELETQLTEWEKDSIRSSVKSFISQHYLPKKVVDKMRVDWKKKVEEKRREIWSQLDQEARFQDSLKKNDFGDRFRTLRDLVDDMLKEIDKEEI